MLCTVDNRYILAKVSEQVNSNCPQEYDFATFKPFIHKPCPLKLPTPKFRHFIYLLYPASMITWSFCLHWCKLLTGEHCSRCGDWHRIWISQWQLHLLYICVLCSFFLIHFFLDICCHLAFCTCVFKYLRSFHTVTLELLHRLVLYVVSRDRSEIC